MKTRSEQHDADREYLASRGWIDLGSTPDRGRTWRDPEDKGPTHDWHITYHAVRTQRARDAGKGGNAE